MSPCDPALRGFVLEPGEVLGDRFLIQRWDSSDPAWPALALDFRSNRLLVQLSAHPVGPWFPDTQVVNDWTEPWPKTSTEDLLPMIHCPALLHGAGVLAVYATPYREPVLAGHHGSCEESDDSQSDTSTYDQIIAAPERLRQQIRHLHLLHQASATLETLHRSHQAHGMLSWRDFRRGTEERPTLRPAPTGQESVRVPSSRLADLAALQHFVLETMPPDRLAHDALLGHESDNARLVRASLRAVLHRRFRSGQNGVGITAWRHAVQQLLNALTTCVLTDSARSTRHDVIAALLGGEMDHAIELTSVCPDPWCGELHHHLEVRRDRTHAEYADWTRQEATQPLLERCEQLLHLIHQGFVLPTPPPIPALDGRLTTCELHLREAASAIRKRSWRQARYAIGAATCLDPVNTPLATLRTCLPSEPPDATGIPEVRLSRIHA